jgi:Flp pilus assembly protein TadG
VSSPPYLILKKPLLVQRGQSLVEFAVSSVMLLLLVGGLVDIGRSIYIQEGLSNAVREGARHGAWYDAPSRSHPYLDNAMIQADIDTELAAASLPASLLKNPGTTCPTPTDGNGYHNPPYAPSAYPAGGGQPWLYICYDNTPGLDFPTSPATNQGQLDLNVILLYTYGPLTPSIKSQFGVFQVAANQHVTVQGS